MTQRPGQRYITVSIHAPLHREERRATAVYELGDGEVSIHAPLHREERRSGLRQALASARVSIHAPLHREERLDNGYSAEIIVSGFNPRPSP